MLLIGKTWTVRSDRLLLGRPLYFLVTTRVTARKRILVEGLYRGLYRQQYSSQLLALGLMQATGCRYQSVYWNKLRQFFCVEIIFEICTKDLNLNAIEPEEEDSNLIESIGCCCRYGQLLLLLDNQFYVHATKYCTVHYATIILKSNVNGGLWL